MKEQKDNKNVLISVGTTQFQSLIQAADKEKFVSLTKRLGYDNILYQIGKTGQYIPRNGQHFRVSADINLIYKKADLIVCHGGAGTLLQNLHNNKVIIAVANDSLQGNHQVQIIRELSKEGYIKGFDSVSQFEKSFDEIEEWLKSGNRKEYGRPQTSILNQIVFEGN